MLTISGLIILGGSFALSAVLTAVVRNVATRVGFVARPSTDRYHTSVIPLGGGIAIFATVVLSLITAAVAIKFLFVPGHLSQLAEKAGVNPADFVARFDELIVILLAVTALFILGLWDDKKHLGPFFKLTVQFAVAFVAAYFAEVRVELFIQNRFVTSLFSAFWIVLIINAFNFLDNMDGLSTGIAAITAGILFIAAAASGQVFVGGLALVFIGALLGFLLFNFPPAGIFMGDAGSLVIGFFVAMLSLRTTYYQQAASGRWYAVLMPLVAMAVPLYDFISVTLIRISQGRSPFVGDTQHFSHRLKRRGLTDTQVILTLYLACLATGLGATFLDQVNRTGAILILVQTVLILFIISILEATSPRGPAENYTDLD